MAKKITLPIGNKIIFDYMAEAYMTHEKRKPKNPEEYVKELSDDLAKEAFLHSFTPSGEIGSGENPRRVKSTDFFEHFDDLFSPDSGIIAYYMPHAGKAKIKQTIKEVKSVIVSLVKIYSSFNHPKMSARDQKRFNLFVAVIITNTIKQVLCISNQEVIKDINSKVLSRLSGSDFIEALK